MATASQAPGRTPSLQELAQRHLWMHFSRMGAYGADHEIPIIVRGEGCYVYDEHGKRYLDGLSGLFCVNAGHGRAELGEAAGAPGRRARLLHALELRPPAGDRAGGADRRARPRRPQPRLLHLRRLGGGRVGAEARPQLPPHARQRPEAQGDRPRGRLPRHLAGRALGDRDHRAAHASSSRSTPGGCHVPNTNIYRWPEDRDPLWAADAIEERIVFEGPETVAAVILEPVQNAGGCFVPPDGYFQRVREICDRYDVLLISDEVICAWGRLGHYFGCERFGYLPDIITTAKGLTSAYAPMGAVIASDQRRRAVHARATPPSPTASPSPATRSPRRSRWPTSTSSSARTSAATCCAKEGEFRADAGEPARPADRRRRARRRLLPRDRAGQGQGDQGELRRRGVRASCCAASSPASSTSAG